MYFNPQTTLLHTKGFQPGIHNAFEQMLKSFQPAMRCGCSSCSASKDLPFRVRQ